MAGKKEDKKWAEKSCICKKCPTFKECKEKIAFCLNGKSKCIKSQSGCLCPTCPIQKKFNFNKVYYCIEGKAK